MLKGIATPVASQVVDDSGLPGGTVTAALDSTRDKSITFTIDTPTSSDVYPIVQFRKAVTITKVTATVKGGTSVTFNMDERSSSTLNSTGTNVMTSSLVATQSGANTTTFSNAGIAVDAFLVLVTSALSGVVNQLVIKIDFTVDAL